MSTRLAPSPAALPTALPALAGADPFVQHPRRSFVEQIMGLPISVHVRGPLARSPQVARAVQGLFGELRADDERFSTWKPHSQVSRIRRGELRLADAGARVRAAAALCEQAAARTGGAFTAWLPGPDGVPAFDPTGLVKGWAVDQAFAALLESLAAFGPHDAMVCAGGDIAVSCAREDTPDWRIGIEDPRDPTQLLFALPVRVGTVATSGTAARGRHIVDPRTGVPACELLSATVIGPELTWSDVYATAAFVGGRDSAAWLAELPGHAAVLVDASGAVTRV